jgi:hypothetical protein
MSLESLINARLLAVVIADERAARALPKYDIARAGDSGLMIAKAIDAPVLDLREEPKAFCLDATITSGCSRPAGAACSFAGRSLKPR